MPVGPDSSNATYVAALRQTLASWRERGVRHAVFGDIFLADLRQWREALLAELSMSGVFPLWQADTRALAGEFVSRGFKALTCCVNDAWLGERDVGRALDREFFAGLGPASIPAARTANITASSMPDRSSGIRSPSPSARSSTGRSRRPSRPARDRRSHCRPRPVSARPKASGSSIYSRPR